MELPKFFIKIYHLLPLPKKIKVFFRNTFYNFAIPLIKRKRQLQVSKKLTFEGIGQISDYKNNVGICKFSDNLFSEDILILYPLMTSLPSLFEEIIKEKIYFKHSKIEPDDIVVDAGANIGIFSTIAASMTQERGRVLCLEPDPVNIEFLKWNKEINKLNNMEIISKAVWKEKGEIDFYINELYSAASGVYSGYSKKIKVNADSIDNLLADINLEHGEIFLKMDVEGAEIEAIKGMEFLLKHPKLKGVIAAYHKIPAKENNGKAIRAHTIIEPILRKNGFQVINENGFLYFWR